MQHTNKLSISKILRSENVEKFKSLHVVAILMTQELWSHREYKTKSAKACFQNSTYKFSLSIKIKK